MKKGKVVTFCPVITTHTAYLVKMIKKREEVYEKGGYEALVNYLGSQARN